MKSDHDEGRDMVLLAERFAPLEEHVAECARRSGEGCSCPEADLVRRHERRVVQRQALPGRDDLLTRLQEARGKAESARLALELRDVLTALDGEVYTIRLTTHMVEVDHARAEGLTRRVYTSANSLTTTQTDRLRAVLAAELAVMLRELTPEG